MGHAMWHGMIDNRPRRKKKSNEMVGGFAKQRKVLGRRKRSSGRRR